MSGADPAAFSSGPSARHALRRSTSPSPSSRRWDSVTSPRTADVARLVVTVQMLADLAVIAVVIRMIFGAVTRGVARRGQPDEPTLPTETNQ